MVSGVKDGVALANGAGSRATRARWSVPACYSPVGSSRVGIDSA